MFYNIKVCVCVVDWGLFFLKDCSLSIENVNLHYFLRHFDKIIFATVKHIYS